MKEAHGNHIGYLPIPGEKYVLLNQHFYRAEWPADVALTRIGAWPKNYAERKAINPECFDDSFKPANDELLFWLGFPGSYAKRHDPRGVRIRTSYFEHLEINGFPFLCQQAPGENYRPQSFNPAQHFILHYPTTAIAVPGGPEIELHSPRGMSGSLVWDTKFQYARKAGIEWSPQMARICGFAHSAESNPNVVIATKIEFIRPHILKFLRLEAAYFHWISRGKPLWG